MRTLIFIEFIEPAKQRLSSVPRGRLHVGQSDMVGEILGSLQIWHVQIDPVSTSGFLG